MISFKQFANLMGRSVMDSRTLVTETLLKTMESVALEAKAYIGHELSEWPALAESTVEEKSKLGYTGRLSATDPLLRTGEMRASIGAYAVGSVGVVGSNEKKALWQEMGTLRATGSIPPRPFIGMAMSRAEPQAMLFFGELAVAMLTPKGVK
jgi:phage gpG-like protein